MVLTLSLLLGQFLQIVSTAPMSTMTSSASLGCHHPRSAPKKAHTSPGFGNLKTAVEPISEEFEKYLLTSLIEELNNLFPVNLATDFICDRFMDSEVFDETMMDRTALILIGASHLRNTGRLFRQEDWRVIDLTTPGWRISENSVKTKVEELKNMADDIDLKSSVCVLQLYDNSIYLVGGPGGVKHLPARDPTGKYHVDGPLIVADKSGVKDLTAKLMPLLRELGECKKVFLTPLGWRPVAVKRITSSTTVNRDISLNSTTPSLLCVTALEIPCSPGESPITGYSALTK